MGLLDIFKPNQRKDEASPSQELPDPRTLVFLNGMPKEFPKWQLGFSLVSKLKDHGMEPGDKLVFDNSEQLSSLVTTRHPSLGEGEVGLILMGELAATCNESTDSRLHTLIEKNGGIAAVKSEILLTDKDPMYVVNIAGAKVSMAQANQVTRPPLLLGSFSGIAEVDPSATSRSVDNLEYQADLLKLGVGNTAIVLGAVCHFHGQKSDNVFVQCGDTIGGVRGAAKNALTPFISKWGYDDGYRVAVAAWLMIFRESQRKFRVDLVLDTPLSIR